MARRPAGAIDPDGFRSLDRHADHAVGWAKSDALNKLTWIVIRKGGLVRDITVGDCFELTKALQEHHFRGSAGRPLFYAMLKKADVLPAAAPERLRVLRLDGRRSIEQIVDAYGIECRPVRDLLVEYLTERSPELDHTSLRSVARNLCRLFWRDLEAQSRVKARMDQRTRTQLPLLPALLRAVEQHRKEAEERINAAAAAPAGTRFAAGGQEFQRCRQGESNRVCAVDLDTGKRRDLTHEESAAFWSWATVEVLRHTGIRIEEMLELTHHSFVAYTLPTTGEVVPMLQVAPSKTDAERLLLVSPELGEVLTAIIFRAWAGKAALPLVSAYDVFEQTWSPPMPFLFQRCFDTEDRPLTRSYIRECLVTTSQAAQITAAGQPLEWRPHDFRRIFVTDAIRSGLPPHIAAKVYGHSTVDTIMGYAAIYPEDVIAHHRAFIARRRAERPSEEYRDLTAQEWDEFLAHFELRKVALGTCGRDHGTPCAHENAWVRCPLLRGDPTQIPRLESIHANLIDRLEEAKEQGWFGELTAIETTLAAAEQKLVAMRSSATQHTTTTLGMPGFRPAVGRSSFNS